MEWRLDKDRPICPQIEEQIAAAIARGDLKEGEKLFSVREAAVQAGVNPNTVQKAFTSLEREGLIFSRAGAGWYVSEGTEKALSMVENIARLRTKTYLDGMRALGKTNDDILKLIKEVSNE